MINFNTYPSLEAQISAISDDIAYNNHDIQDGIRAKLFSFGDLIEIRFFKEILKSYKKHFKNKNQEILIYQVIRDSINLMVKDIIKNTINNIKKNKIKNTKDIYNSSNLIVCPSRRFSKIDNEIKSFLRLKMYNNRNVLKKNNNGKKIINKLFNLICKKPYKYINKQHFIKKDKYRVISDYISGMTDRYAISLYSKNK